MLTAFDLFLTGLAFIIMIAGFSRRWSAWRMGREENRSGDWAGLFGYLLGHRKILMNRTPGMAHLILVGGFLVPLIIIILSQFELTVPTTPARILSLMMDILGAAFLAGTMFFLLRRIRSTDQRGPKKTLFPMFLLCIILITGFLAEGARLSILPPRFIWDAPLGWLLSLSLPASPFFMQSMIRVHLFAVLLFIAILPFTFVRHLVAAPLNVFYKRENPRGELKGISLDEGHLGADTVKDFTWKQLLDAEACVSCGRCEENCPAFISGKPLSPRKVIQDIFEQMAPFTRRGANADPSYIPPLDSRITGDEIWSCTTCMACVEHCPIFVEPMDKIIDMRRSLLMGKGLLPAEARPMIRNLEIYGDVHGKGVSRRLDWAFNREIPLLSNRGDRGRILLWVGCSGAFHPGYQEVSRAMVKILKAGGIEFEISGKGELCCGDPARRLGEESLFLDLAHRNVRRLNGYNVRKIVTLCPHCFNTLKNEYPLLGGEFEVIHAAEFALNLIKDKRILPRYPINKVMAIHDPCYLGRGNRIYEPLREVCASVPGVELIELPRNREDGFCCGGGGGRMWLHEGSGHSINRLRADEVSETRADLLATACPYCMTMIDDGIKSLELERPPGVMDVIQILASSI